MRGLATETVSNHIHRQCIVYMGQHVYYTCSVQLYNDKQLATSVHVLTILTQCSDNIDIII